MKSTLNPADYDYLPPQLLERLGRAIDASGEADDFCRGRRAAIEFFLGAIVPEALGLGAAIVIGAEPLYAAPVAGFA